MSEALSGQVVKEIKVRKMLTTDDGISLRVPMPKDITALRLPPGSVLRAVLVESPDPWDNRTEYIVFDPRNNCTYHWPEGKAVPEGLVRLKTLMVQPPESDAERRSRLAIEQFCAKHGLQLSKYAEPLKQLVDDAAKGG